MRTLNNGHFLIGIGITLAALLGATAIPGDPADAATISASNWLRSCSTVHSHPVSTGCTLTPSIQPHQLTYLDAAGKKHVLSSGSAVWSFAKAHSVRCTAAQRACWDTDDVTRSKVISLGNRVTYTLAFFHH